MNKRKTVLTLAAMVALGSALGAGTVAAVTLDVDGNVGVNGSLDRSAGGVHGDVGAGVNAPIPSINRAPAESQALPLSDVDNGVDRATEPTRQKTAKKARRLKSGKQLKSQTELDSDDSVSHK